MFSILKVNSSNTFSCDTLIACVTTDRPVCHPGANGLLVRETSGSILVCAERLLVYIKILIM